MSRYGALRGAAAVRGKGVLVIGQDMCIGTGIVRSLGRQGIPVCVLQRRQNLAAFSRYTQRHFSWPAGEDDERVDYLLNVGARHGFAGWGLFVTDDESMRLVARYHATLAKQFRLATPAWEQIRWAYDKQRTYRLAAELNIPYPWTAYPDTRKDVEILECAFPVLLKPVVKRKDNRFTSARAWRVENRRELVARYDEACTLVDPGDIMIQELLPGGGKTRFSFAALCCDGHPLAFLVARRTRQHPVEFGQMSTFVETMDQPDVEMAARRLLSATKYNGLVEIEFKLDTRTGQYKVHDVNARLWGWHTIGPAAGIDFPYLQWRVLCGESVAEVRGQAGVRWARMTGDVRAALTEVRGGTLPVRAYLRSLRSPLSHAMFATDDPLPGILEIPLLIYRRWMPRCP